MAISVQFNGSTIFKPGAYSKTTIDVGGGFPIGPAGLIAVFGEADAGAPGSTEVDIRNNRFTADQLPQIRAKYRSGPIVDAASFLFAPAADAAIPSGAQTVWFYKTNASVRSSLVLANSYGTVRSLEWGIGGNRVTVEILNVAEVGPVITGTTIALFGATLNGLTFNFFENGVAKSVQLSTTPADHADIATLVTELSTKLLAASSTIVVSNVGDALRFSLPADALAYQKGWAKSLVLNGVVLDLAAAGLVPVAQVSASETVTTINLAQPRDLLTESDTVGGNVVLEIGHDGSSGVTAASVTINATSVTLNQTPSAVHTFLKANYPTVKELADDIDLLPGWTASVANAQYNQLSPDILDQVTSVGALSTFTFQPAMIKKDAAEVQSMFDNSNIAELVTPAECGLPTALTKVALTGGAKGGSSSVDMINALEKFTKFQVNFIVPLFSRDATDDISDGLTDATSTYTIDGIHQAVKTHISLMKTTKKRSERQGYLSLKKSFVACKTKAGDLADGRLQLVIQDVRQVDAAGNILWFQPWAFAAMLAGARSGAPIGEPMTFKFLNVSGIRHTAQPMSTAEADIVIDFDPDLQSEEAIEAGITFMEARQTGGFRVVVDNTTYGRDANFVWNRANVIYAADIVAFNLRTQLENIYVGRKNTVKTAEVAGSAASILEQLKAQGVTVATADAPNGFKDLSVQLNGNVIYVTVVVKIVEGIDFILNDITIQRATAA